MPRRQLVSFTLRYDRVENAPGDDVKLEEVREAIARLPPREQRVIRLRYFNEKKARTSYAAIGREEGVSKERSRQITRRALSRLRKFLEAD